MVLAAKGKLYTEFAALNVQYEPQPTAIGSLEKADPERVETMTGMHWQSGK